MRSINRFSYLQSWGEKRSQWLAASESLWEIAQLDIQLFINPWSVAQWEELLTTDQNYILGSLQRRGNIMAFALLLYNPWEELGHLLKIFVHPEYRKKHIGIDLWQKVQKVSELQGAKRIYLEVEKSNHAANSFYQKLGFVSLNEVSHFYGAGRCALTYHLILN